MRGSGAVFPAVLLAVWLGCVQTGSADTLTLRDGRTFDGDYVGGSRDTLHFRTGGEVAHIPIKDVSGLTFSGRVERPLSAPAPVEKTVIVPAESGMEHMEIQRMPATPARNIPPS